MRLNEDEDAWFKGFWWFTIVMGAITSILITIGLGLAVLYLGQLIGVL